MEIFTLRSMDTDQLSIYESIEMVQYSPSLKQ